MPISFIQKAKIEGEESPGSKPGLSHLTNGTSKGVVWSNSEQHKSKPKPLFWNTLHQISTPVGYPPHTAAAATE